MNMAKESFLNQLYGGIDEPGLEDHRQEGFERPKYEESTHSLQVSVFVCRRERVQPRCLAHRKRQIAQMLGAA
jgi:hypothetical protein